MISMQKIGKRLFDIIFAASGIIILSPIIVAGALAVKLSSEGPAFFRQKRVGRAGRPFTLYKLRTMHMHNDKTYVSYPEDRRVFSVGRILRWTKIDELPQLFNVLIGDMSFVGPRPEVPAFIVHYQSEWRRILGIRPGITGIGSLLFRGEEKLLSAAQDRETWYINQILPRKITMELEYLKKASFALDLRLIMLTLTTSLSCSSAVPFRMLRSILEDESLKTIEQWMAQAVHHKLN